MQARCRRLLVVVGLGIESNDVVRVNGSDHSFDSHWGHESTSLVVAAAAAAAASRSRRTWKIFLSFSSFEKCLSLAFLQGVFLQFRELFERLAGSDSTFLMQCGLRIHLRVEFELRQRDLS